MTSNHSGTAGYIGYISILFIILDKAYLEDTVLINELTNSLSLQDVPIVWHVSWSCKHASSKVFYAALTV